MAVALGLGALVVVPALPASGRSVSGPNLKALTNSINRAKTLTYLAQYTSVNSGQKTTVTIAQVAPQVQLLDIDGNRHQQREDDVLLLEYRLDRELRKLGRRRIGNTGNTGNTGNSGNSGASTTTSTTAPKSSMQCLSVKGSNPLLGLEDLFSPTVALGALAEAKEGLVSRLLGIKVSSSSATFAGQPSTCVTVTVRGKGGKYCVTKQGLLSYSGSSSSSYFELTKYSSEATRQPVQPPGRGHHPDACPGAPPPPRPVCRTRGRRARSRVARPTTSASTSWPQPESTCTVRPHWSTRSAPARSSMRAVAPAAWPSSSTGAAMQSSASMSIPPCSTRRGSKAPDLAWVEGDVTDPDLELGRTFDVVVMAGNVLIFVPPGTEGRVIANAARWLKPGGRVVTGYSIRQGGFGATRPRRPGGARRARARRPLVDMGPPAFRPARDAMRWPSTAGTA